LRRWSTSCEVAKRHAAHDVPPKLPASRGGRPRETVLDGYPGRPPQPRRGALRRGAAQKKKRKKEKEKKKKI
jgi:hypothetical protein